MSSIRPALSRKHALVIATGNHGKLAEFRTLLAALPIEVLSLSDVGADTITIVEDGATFEANAIKKANAIAAATHMMTLADDSGLEVDALGGKPGVRSARFAHERATDAENNAALLAALGPHDDTPSTGFTARFRCVLALVDPFSGDDTPKLAVGSCEGAIVTSPRGSFGFGYDPLFVVDGTEGKTMAELSLEEKNTMSHRACAFRVLLPLIESRLLARDATVNKVIGS